MLDARVDIGDVQRGLRGLVRASQDIGPLLQAARKPLRTDQREHQKRRRGPDGPWPGPAASTLRRRARARKKRRRRGRPLGRLPGVLTVRVLGRDTLVARSRVAWAYVHQEGGRVGRGARIPARPFLYFGDEFLDDIDNALREYLARGFGKE